jgi:hypothetical protein
MQLVKNCEQIDDNYVVLAGDINRHKAQLYFAFEPPVKKGTAIIIKSGVISRSGKLVTIAVERESNMVVQAKSIFTDLSPGNLSWPAAIKTEKEEINSVEPTTSGKENGTPKKAHRNNFTVL